MKKRKIYGRGINDADYPVRPTVNGVRLHCPYYQTWKQMLRRCYAEEYLIRTPTYRGCYVTESWFSLMTFRAWMETQDWQGKDLDKDLLVHNNKEYGPSTCLFVPPKINQILHRVSTASNLLPRGVSRFTRTGRIRATIVDPVHRYLGTFDTPHEAHRAWQLAKIKVLFKAAEEHDEPLRQALKNHAERIRSDYDQNKETK